MKSWLIIVALGTPLWSQCFDLSTTHLYQPDGRFKEWWDHPLWNGKPGEANYPGNFRLDQQEYGKHVLHFAIFMGTIRKTDAGWVPFRAERRPQVFCDHSGPRGSLFCWTVPYQKPSAQAMLMPRSHKHETWSLTRSGVLTYAMQSRDYPVPAGVPFGTEDATATLNLETGQYEMTIHDHGKGMHEWAIKGGVELWREITFTARAKLTPVACPATLEKVSSNEIARQPKIVEMDGLRPCAVRAKSKPGELPADFEFIQNPMNLGAPQGCILVHEEPIPLDNLRMAQGAKDR